MSGPATRFDTGPLLRRSESCARASYKLYNGYLGLQQSIETMANSHNLLFSPRDEESHSRSVCTGGRDHIFAEDCAEYRYSAV